jgi:hypothetical protein
MQVIKVTRVRCSRFIIKHPDLDPLGVYLHCIIYSKQLARHQSSRFVSSFPSLETRSLRAVRYDTLLSLNSAKEVRIDILLGRRFVAGILQQVFETATVYNDFSTTNTVSGSTNTVLVPNTPGEERNRPVWSRIFVCATVDFTL